MIISRWLAIFIVILASASSLQAGEVYKNVDESGKVEFTDQPDPGAETVKIDEPNTVKATPVPPVRPGSQAAPTPPFGIEITAPTDQQVFQNRLATITVTTAVTPELKPGMSERLLVDGAVHSTGRGTFSIDGLTIGEHTLQVELVARTGKVITRSAIITIFTRQPG